MEGPPKLRPRLSHDRLDRELLASLEKTRTDLRILFVGSCASFILTVLAYLKMSSVYDFVGFLMPHQPRAGASLFSAKPSDDPTSWDRDGDGDVDTEDLAKFCATFVDQCGDGDGQLEASDVLSLLTKLAIAVWTLLFFGIMCIPLRPGVSRSPFMRAVRKTFGVTVLLVVPVAIYWLASLFGESADDRKGWDRDGDGDVDATDLKMICAEFVDKCGDGDGLLEASDVFVTFSKLTLLVCAMVIALTH